MSQHRSFGAGGLATGRHRSVLKRYEKIQSLAEKDAWTEEKGVYGLPKVKVLKIKAKKSGKSAKDEKKEEQSK